MSRRPLAQWAPFALLRDLPQLGFFLLALVLCGDLAVIGHHENTHRTPSGTAAAGPVIPPGSPEQDLFGSPVTGPVPGQDAHDYQVRRGAELALRAREEPAAHGVAVVSFRAPLRVSDLAGSTDGLPVTTVFVRVRIPGAITGAGQGRVVPGAATGSTTGARTGTTALLVRAAAAVAEDARNNLSQAATVGRLDIAVNAAQKAAFLQEGRVEEREVAVLRAGGQCLYGAVVTGTYTQLQALTRLRYVRLVDPADDGVTADTIVAHALPPDASGALPALEQLPGLAAP